jgi:hypothetical protein
MTAYLLGALALVALAVVARFGWSYFRLRGTRVVTCPETQQKAAVEIDTPRAAGSAILGKPNFRLEACSHWPEKQGCGQACLSQIANAPLDCLVRTRLENWYRDKTCALCRRPVGNVDWYDRHPALLTPTRQPVTWQELPAERLDEVLATHQALCFDCYVAETFRRAHPELVLDNPYASQPPGRA